MEVLTGDAYRFARIDYNNRIGREITEGKELWDKVTTWTRLIHTTPDDWWKRLNQKMTYERGTGLQMTVQTYSSPITQVRDLLNYSLYIRGY